MTDFSLLETTESSATSLGMCPSRVPQKLSFTFLAASKTQTPLGERPTWPRKACTYFPVRPSHSRTDLSKEAEANHRPSGEKATWFTILSVGLRLPQVQWRNSGIFQDITWCAMLPPAQTSERSTKKHKVCQLNGSEDLLVARHAADWVL